ncbi:MAG: glycoside hydrolase family 3 C-terminal domain-containing protein [Pigmentiphaga sp.]|nr:glycoside hydrolase family 3 C-terminal domain-containing protein [Pigmentiphaga sp.]
MKKYSLLFAIFFSVLPFAQQNSIVDSDITDNLMYTDNVNKYKPISASENVIQNAVYADSTKSAALRAHDLISRLTLDEKLQFTGGYNRFQIAPVERLGIRPVFMADASQGVRLKTLSIKGKSTSFPGMLPLASTWNEDLAMQFGRAIGEECHALGVDILLGPGINMQRLSVGGRNFEYMGEDPYLTSIVSTNYIKGLESTGIISCPKHYIFNDQEFCRHIANYVVSERALREIYLLPWEHAIKDAGCSAIMTGNNWSDGVPLASNKKLNADLLRKEFGFDGIVMTDWQNSNYFPFMQNLILESGQTLLMPDNQNFEKWFKEVYKKSTEDKQIEMELLLDKMIFYTIQTLFKKGIYDRYPQDPEYFRTLPQHQLLARECAEEAIILLKNEENILPVSTKSKIVLLGNSEIHSGSGSGYVAGYDHVSFEDGLKSVYKNNFIRLQKIDPEILQQADVILFNLNKLSGEGKDIPFEIGSEYTEQIKEIAKYNKNVVVLVNSSNGFPMDWIPDAKGILWCNFLGQERGNALANIISGIVSPSGKLPFTIEKNFKDSPDPTYNYLGNKPYWLGNNEYKKYWLGQSSVFETAFTDYVKPFELIPQRYDEDVLMGYRWYDYHNIPVNFPFGYGLSYSKFKYSGFKVKNNFKKTGQIIVEVKVKNIGKIAAKEVVQLYVSNEGNSIICAPKELKAFKKLNLLPGETQKVIMKLDEKAFSFWNEDIHDWCVKNAKYLISVRKNSADAVFLKEINIY